MALFASLAFNTLYELKSYLLLCLLHVQTYSLTSVPICPEVYL